MEEKKFCQSCMMPLDAPESFGTEKDGSPSADYCQFCYRNGEFTGDMTMEQMIEFCAPFNGKAGLFPTEAAAREGMRPYFAKLKRWAAK